MKTYKVVVLNNVGDPMLLGHNRLQSNEFSSLEEAKKVYEKEIEFLNSASQVTENEPYLFVELTENENGNVEQLFCSDTYSY